MERYQLTKEGVAKLEAEYRHLLDVVRPQNTKDIVDIFPLYSTPLKRAHYKT